MRRSEDLSEGQGIQGMCGGGLSVLFIIKTLG